MSRNCSQKIIIKTEYILMRQNFKSHFEFIVDFYFSNNANINSHVQNICKIFIVTINCFFCMQKRENGYINMCTCVCTLCRRHTSVFITSFMNSFKRKRLFLVYSKQNFLLFVCEMVRVHTHSHTSALNLYLNKKF